MSIYICVCVLYIYTVCVLILNVSDIYGKNGQFCSPSGMLYYFLKNGLLFVKLFNFMVIYCYYTIYILYNNIYYILYTYNIYIIF